MSLSSERIAVSQADAYLYRATIDLAIGSDKPELGLETG